MIIDIGKDGFKEGLKKALNVIKYIIAAMAVVGLGMFIADQTVTFDMIKLPMLVAGANVLIVFLQKWTSTKTQ